jgi:hypothetical protein
VFNLNDIEYSENITAILQSASRLNYLSAEADIGALRQGLAIIEDSARKAHWRLDQLVEARK